MVGVCSCVRSWADNRPQGKAQEVVLTQTRDGAGYVAHRNGAGHAPRYLGVQTPHHVLQAVGLLVVGGIRDGLQHNLTITFHNRWGDYEDSSLGNSMFVFTKQYY